jgi:hypothetical protein
MTREDCLAPKITTQQLIAMLKNDTPSRWRCSQCDWIQNAANDSDDIKFVGSPTPLPNLREPMLNREAPTPADKRLGGLRLSISFTASPTSRTYSSSALGATSLHAGMSPSASIASSQSNAQITGQISPYLRSESTGSSSIPSVGVPQSSTPGFSSRSSTVSFATPPESVISRSSTSGSSRVSSTVSSRFPSASVPPGSSTQGLESRSSTAAGSEQNETLHEWPTTSLLPSSTLTGSSKSGASSAYTGYDTDDDLYTDDPLPSSITPEPTRTTLDTDNNLYIDNANRGIMTPPTAHSTHTDDNLYTENIVPGSVISTPSSSRGSNASASTPRLSAAEKGKGRAMEIALGHGLTPIDWAARIFAEENMGPPRKCPQTNNVKAPRFDPSWFPGLNITSSRNA